MNTIPLYTAEYTHNAQIEQQGSRILVRAPYHPELVEELKWFDGARWDHTRKAWSFPASHRNLWSLQFMGCADSVERYRDPVTDEVLPEQDFLPLVHHATGDVIEWRLKQFDMVRWAMQKRQCIWAAEMRVGKTPSYFQVIMQNPTKKWWIVAPRKVLAALRVEIAKWGFGVDVELMTYEGMKKRCKSLSDRDVPWGIIYDEASKLKGRSQRTMAAVALSERMDRVHGPDCMRILGTGTPQPKNYLDWYFLCEVARPGFLPWGNIHKFDEWISVREKAMGLHGQEFWSRIQFRDGSDCVKCQGAGRLEVKRKLGGVDKIKCSPCNGEGRHDNKVQILEQYLADIAIVVLKKDVLELPEKERVTIDLSPSQTMMNVAKAITEQGLPAAEILQRHRQLSDGFQYVRDEIPDTLDPKTGKPKYKIRIVRGKKNPKIAATKELLAAHEEVGRFVIFGAYKASIDWLCETAQEEGWDVIRVDGSHNVVASWDPTLDGAQALLEFDKRGDGRKIAVIGHPKSLGYGFDLSASPGFLFYSLDYDGETFMQAIERGHSSGMDLELGCTLYFLHCLPTDAFVLANVETKKGVQDVTVADIQELYRTR